MVTKLIKFLLLFCFVTSANAYYDLGKPTGFVNDYAGVLNVQQRQALESKLSQFNKESSNEIAVVTIQSLQGDTIENFAVELFSKWGIGKKNKDNGVLILVALQDREVRIEVGYGLEGALTDAQASWITNDIITPAFRNNNYYQGIDGAVDKIIAATKGEYVPSAENVVTSAKEDLGKNKDSIAGIIITFFVVLSILRAILGKKKPYLLGGVVGVSIGVIVGLFMKSLAQGILFVIVLGLLGPIFDFLILLPQFIDQNLLQAVAQKSTTA